MLSAARLAALAGLLLATAHQRPPSGVTANHPIKSALMVGAGVGWLGWMARRRRGASDRTTWCFLALLAASGGALAALAPSAITFMAVAGLAAGIAFEGFPASGVGAIGVGALVVATSAVDSPTVLIAEGAVAVVVGLMIGASPTSIRAADASSRATPGRTGPGRRRAGSSGSAGRTQPDWT